MKKSNNKISKIAAVIKKWIQDGSPFNKKLLEFISSTTGEDPLAALRRMIRNPEYSDAQTLFGMAFFPDLDLQLKIEPILKKETLDKDDITGVISVLSAQNSIAISIESGTGKDARFYFPTRIIDIDGLVARLKLDRIIPERIGMLIEKAARKTGNEMRIRVVLRNASFSFDEEACLFFESLIPGIDTKKNDLEEVISIAARIIENSRPHRNIVEGLQQYKGYLSKAILASARRDNDIRQHPAEVLILRGISIPAISAKKAQEEMKLIDAISMAAYHTVWGVADRAVSITASKKQEDPHP